MDRDADDVNVCRTSKKLIEHELICYIIIGSTLRQLRLFIETRPGADNYLS